MFRSTVFLGVFVTKENIVKFLIRQKETGNLETEMANNTESRERAARLQSSRFLTLPSHDFVHGAPLGFAQVYFIDGGGRELGGGGWGDCSVDRQNKSS